jgi:hypothetical protein
LSSVDLPEPVRRALQENAAQVGSNITVAWKSQSHSPTPVPELAKLMKIDEEWAERLANDRAMVRPTWQDGKYLNSSRRLSSADAGAQRFHRHDSGCDGEDLFSWSTRVDGEGVPIPLEPGIMSAGCVIESLTNKTSQLESDFTHSWYFQRAGIRLPTRIRDLQQKRPVRSEILTMLEEGARLTSVDEVEIDDRKLTRLRIVVDNPDRKHAEKADPDKHAAMLEGTAETEEGKQDLIAALLKRRELPEHLIHVFWLDPQLNYAVRRHEQQYRDEILLTRVECTDYRKFAERKVYLPHKITTQNYTAERNPGVFFKQPLLFSVIEVTELKVDPLPDEQFVLSFKLPGHMVSDQRDPNDVVNYLVDEDGEWPPLP